MVFTCVWVVAPARGLHRNALNCKIAEVMPIPTYSDLTQFQINIDVPNIGQLKKTSVFMHFYVVLTWVLVD